MSISTKPSDPEDDHICRILLDHTIDTAIRVRTLLTSKKVPEVEKLEPAIKLAAGIIDWFTPAVFEASHDGLSLAKRTNLPMGAFLVALANHQKIGAIVVPAQPNLTDMLVESAHHMRDYVISKDPTLSLAAVSGSVTEQFLNAWGREPGEEPQGDVPDMASRNTLAGLFAVLNDDEIRLIMSLAGGLVRAGLCPAFIVMMAPDTEGGWVGRWPLLFPMAPYVDPGAVFLEEGRA